VGGEVEVVGEEEMPGRDSIEPVSRRPAEVKQTSIKPAPVVAPPPLVVESVAADEGRTIEPKKRSGNLALAIIAALVGLIVIAYVYVRTR
jgi:hypothetical protein